MPVEDVTDDAELVREALASLPRPFSEREKIYRAFDRLTARMDAAEQEIADLKSTTVAFAGPWAVTHARDCGLPDGHLHPVHYDILERCGARMTDFTRAVPTPPETGNG